ncbi:unnamed protein product [Ostreobium quekettii]|uniref:RNA-dependent RNA polymerase n=1 Tax=Ostreobium quekettii TaxID=121088 RepID=A0A8S1IP01_9CHLO|nr:unnamed protein product [Ostreobium quekettii]
MKQGFRAGHAAEYKYLAGSNSQNREHACWFVEERAETADGIRNWIGDLHSIKNVASYTARLGLGFSSSENTVSVADNLFDERGEEDVTANGYNFTDGVGRLTVELAEKISAALVIGHTPSAYQIRFGGAKGVVVIDKQLHSDHPGKALVLRKSMIKYPSRHKDIEVLATSRPIRLSLNQQIIMLLSNLGINDNVFLNILKAHLRHMSEMFIDEQLAGQRMMNIASVDSRSLQQAGVHITSEPYLRSLMMAAYRCQMKDLLERSKVPIDDCKGRVLIGVADDTKTLQYGEVFVQYSEDFTLEAALDSDNKSRILECTVVVAKNPCLHPGDVRTFRAVDVPGLHHIYDCIVFPCTGRRPHPDELSGSDLDGDLYHVIWEDDLIPEGPNKQPMDYTASDKVELERPVGIDDVIEHVCQYIQHDNLGLIDTMHLALADMEGVESEDCLTLAEQHSKAVDAPKSGDWQSVDRDIQAKVKKYPDFMMKTRKPSYPSERVLGKMFRECSKYMNVTKPGTGWKGDSGIVLNTGFIMEGYESYVAEAKVVRAEYNNSLSRAMKMYGIRTEGELMSGHIEQLHETVHDREVENVRQTIRLICRRLVDTFRGKFEENVHGDEKKRLQKASAWYFVTYGDDPSLCVETYDPQESHWRKGYRGTEGHKLGAMRFLSFPWIVCDLLAKIYARNRTDNPEDSMPSVSTIIGKSVVREFEKHRPWLLPNWRDRCAMCRAVGRRLKPIGHTCMAGLSAAMLFERKGNLELVLVPNSEADRVSVARDLQLGKRLLDGAEEALYGVLARIKRLSGDPKRAMLLCKLNKGMMPCAAAAQTWFQVTTRILDLQKWSVLVMYIKRYPYLLPILHLLARWMRSIELTDPGHVVVDAYIVPFMFINMCLNRCEIRALDVCPAVQWSEKAASGGSTDVCMDPTSEGWEHALRETQDVGAKRKEQLGKLLLEFFRHGRQQIDSRVGTHFPRVLSHEGSSSFGSLLGGRAAQLLLEEMDRASHRLSLHADASALLTTERVEKLFFVDTKSAHTVLGYESNFGRFLRKRSGAADVEVFPSLGTRAPGLVIKALGTSAALWGIERMVRNLTGQYETEEKNLTVYARTTSAAEGAYCYLVEGSESRDDRVVLEEYYRSSHNEGPHHENASKFVVRVCRCELQVNLRVTCWARRA